ncbi:metal ABC transporter permease [Corynebacterium coyleae]
MPEISFLQFLADMANPQLAFLPRALGAAVIAAVLCAVVGCFVVLRGMAFIGDAVAHAVFPGIAVAFALQTSVLLGGAVAGALVAVLIAVMSQRRTIKEDSVIGIVFTAAFAIGLVIISRVEGYTASVSSFLFGSLTGVGVRELVVNAVAGAIIVAIVVVLRPWLTAVALDRETARAMNLPVAAVDLALYLSVTAHGEDFYAASVSAMLQPALRQRYSQLPTTVQRVFGAENARGPGSPESPTTTVVGLESRQRCSSRAGSRRLLLMTGRAVTASPKHGT